MSDYTYWAEDESESVEHYGISGQKRGKRRFQYEDGSLTPEGRERYRVGKSTSRFVGTSNKAKIRKIKELIRASKTGKPKPNKVVEESDWRSEVVKDKLKPVGVEPVVNISDDEIDVYPNGYNSHQSWYAQYKIKDGQVTMSIIDEKYKESIKDSRSLLKKTADAYVSGWNTIKDTYVSGLKTIAGWFK